MKILYITQYFFPEIGATTNRALANVRYLANKMHDVTVLTELPNHPKGVFFKGYKHKISMKEKMENFIINRVWVFTSRKKNFITRILFYISFMFMGFLNAMLQWKNYDLIYISSPPLFVAGIGLMLKAFHPKVRIVFEVRDLWPKSAIDLGELNNKRAIKLAEKLENAIYTKSDLIVGLTEGIKDYVSKKFPDKTICIPNGVDLTLYNKVSERDRRFKVCYTGTMGLIHSVDTIIEAAKILRNEDIEFQFIGDGAKKNDMIALSEEYDLDKVKFIESVPIEKIQYYLSKASIGISTTKKFELCKGTIPVKIFGYMACELPAIISGWGESVDIIDKAGCGLCVDAENPEQLAEKILYLKNNSEELASMGKSGREFVEKYYNREKQAEQIEFEINKIVGYTK